MVLWLIELLVTCVVDKGEVGGKDVFGFCFQTGRTFIVVIHIIDSIKNKKKIIYPQPRKYLH